MAENIVVLLKEHLNENVLGKIAGILGEEKSGITSAVASSVPSLLLGLMKKGTEPGGDDNLMGMLQEGTYDGGIVEDPGSILDGGPATSKLLSSGKAMLASIFGDKAGELGDMIASASGIRKESGSSLLGLLAPIVMGFLGKKLKASGSFNAKGLMDLLLGQKDNIRAALPAGVSSLLGVGDLDRLGLKKVTAATSPVMKSFPWLLVLISLALVALLFFLWRSCSQPPPPVVDVGEKVVDGAGKALDPLGNFISKKLPNGVELSIPEFGVENKLIAFIEDPQLPVDDNTWFSFDRLTFETGKATLKPESQEQLKNIAEILNAYPKVSIKLGGYTDNTGNPQANLELSRQRAESVMADLAKLGVDAARLQADGYGQEHPVADNSTEEGRAKNRRIDMRVTAK